MNKSILYLAYYNKGIRDKQNGVSTFSYNGKFMLIENTGTVDIQQYSQKIIDECRRGWTDGWNEADNNQLKLI